MKRLPINANSNTITSFARELNPMAVGEYIYIYIYMCVCVCETDRQTETATESDREIESVFCTYLFIYLPAMFQCSCVC